MTREHYAGCEGHRQPFVWINGDGIRLLDAPDQIAVLVTEDSSRAVGAVNVQPQVVTAADFRDGSSVVYGSGIRSAGGRNYAERNAACAFVVVDCCLEILTVKLNAPVYGNAPQRATANSQEAAGFVERVV